MRHSYPGKFIVVEGLGGSGKGTLMDKLEQWCKDSKLDYIRTREPGGTPCAEYIRKLCREGIPVDGDSMTAMGQAMLFNAARAENVQKVILPALEKGLVVLCDRFSDTTVAYQSVTGSLSPSVLKTIHRLVHKINPDMTFLLKGDPATFLGRISPTELASDQFDNLALSKQTAIQDVYLQLADCDEERYTLVDAMQTPEKVFSSIFPVLMQLKNDMRKRPTAAPYGTVEDYPVPA